MTERHHFPVLVHLLVSSGDRLLLLRRTATGIFDGCWAPPGGHLEAGETPRAAVLRETFEEVGIALDGAELRPVALMHYGSAGGGFNLLFSARLQHQPSLQLDRSIADAAQWWPRAGLPDARVPWLDAALLRAERDAESADDVPREQGPDRSRWYVEGH